MNTYDTYNGNESGGFSNSFSNTQKKAIANHSTATVRHVTVKQVLSASQANPDDDFTIDNVPIGQVSFIGVIRNVVDKSTNVTYQIEDGTGTVEARKWTETNDDQSVDGEKDGLNVGTYVSIIANIKAFNDKIHVVVVNMTPILDFNFVAYHLLQSLALHLEFTKSLKQENKNVANGALNGNVEEDSLFVANELSQIEGRILKTIASNPGSNSEGVSVDFIARHLNLDRNECRRHLAVLEENGLIFQGDDDCYMLIEN